jgi:hypothetical protein
MNIKVQETPERLDFETHVIRWQKAVYRALNLALCSNPTILALFTIALDLSLLSSLKAT